MAIFNPILTSPINGEGVDATQIIRFEWEFQSDAGETQFSYRVQIYLSDDDSLVFDSNTITSSNKFYNLTGGTLTNGNRYFYVITTSSVSATRSNRIPQSFATLAPATVTIDTIITPVGQFYKFSATYSQAQNVPVRAYQWRLYDASDVLLETGDIKFGTPIEQTFTGFTSGTTYKVDVTVVNQNDVTVVSPRISFTPSFSVPADSPEIIVTGRSDLSAIEVDWTNIIVLNGQVIGSFSYVPGKFDLGLQLVNNSCLQYDMARYLIPEDFTSAFWIKLDSSHDGDFWRLRKDGDIRYRVGYNSDLKKFYYERGTRFVLSPVVNLPDDFIFVAVTPTAVWFRTATGQTWSAFPTGISWNNGIPDGYTWNDLSQSSFFFRLR